MVTIVPVAQAHASSYRTCLDAVAREKRYLAQIEALPLERIEGFVRDSVAGDAIQFMAVDAGRVVGWADIFPAWAHAVAHCGSLGMGVLAAYRGQGLGRRLLEACLAKAWSKGLTRIELEVRADNERAIGLYKALGFTQEAVKRNAMRFDGVYFDALQMSLLRSETAAPAPAARPQANAAISAESVVEFLNHFEAVAAKEDFDLVRDMIDAQAVFRFNDGDFVGREAIQAVFEKTWRGDPSVKKVRFFLSDIVVLSTDHASAAATYTYNWQGAQAGREFTIRGRGTRVLRHEGGRFRIVHEHLSRFPSPA